MSLLLQVLFALIADMKADISNIWSNISFRMLTSAKNATNVGERKKDFISQRFV